MANIDLRGTQTGGGTPMPLSGDAFAQLAQRRRNATSIFQETLARTAQQRGQMDDKFSLARSDLTRGFTGARDSLLRQLGAFGAARSPRQAGRPVREMRDQLGGSLAGLESERAEMLAMLLQIAQDAERQRDLDFSGIEADSARFGVDFNRLLPGVGR